MRELDGQTVFSELDLIIKETLELFNLQVTRPHLRALEEKMGIYAGAIQESGVDGIYENKGKDRIKALIRG